MLISVLHPHTQSRFAHPFLGGPENPDAGIIHLDFYINALARADEDGIKHLGRRSGISIERDHFHYVSVERNAAILDCAGVEEMNEQPLALADTDGIAGTERLVVDGVGRGANFKPVWIAA